VEDSLKSENISQLEGKRKTLETRLYDLKINLDGLLDGSIELEHVHNCMSNYELTYRGTGDL